MFSKQSNSNSAGNDRPSALGIAGMSLAISASSYFGSSALAQQSTEDSRTPLVAATLPVHEGPYRITTREAADMLLKAQRFEPEVFEIPDPVYLTSTFVFTPKPDFARLPGERAVLRYLWQGTDRDQFTKKLSSLGYQVTERRDIVLPKLPEPTYFGAPSGTVSPPTGIGWSTWLLVGLTTVIIGGYIVEKYPEKFERLRRRKYNFGDSVKERFTDIGGAPQIVEELTELKGDIDRVKSGDDSIELPHGALISGEHGVGKTLSARALAGEAECPFIPVNSSSIVATKWAGEWTAALLAKFREARRARDNHTKQLRKLPGATGQEEGVCILFFDEFDSIGRRRSKEDADSSVQREYDDVVNATLAEMDSIDRGLNKNIIVIAATNHPELLDEALLRPGRFTKHMHMPSPVTADQRLDVLHRLSVHIVDERKLTIESLNSLPSMARICVGSSGDELRGILQEAVDIVRREKRGSVTDADLMEAYQRQKFGRRQDNLLSPGKRELVAYHEHGHGLMALAYGVQPFVVSMQPRGGTGGRVILDPEQTYQPPRALRELLGSVLIAAGGRAAELLKYGESGITEGASQDLKQIRQLLIRALSNGMLNDLFAVDVEQADPENLPEEYKAVIDEYTKKALATAKKILEAVGPETMKKLVDESLALDDELIGENARDFYSSRVPADKLEAIKKIAEEFTGAVGATPY